MTRRREVLIVSIFFLILVALFFKDVFQGLVPLPADLIVGGYYPWLDYKWGYEVGVPVKNPILSDVVSVIYPIKVLAIELIKKGEFPLWNWQMFAGYPLWANLQLGLLFPSVVFYFLFSAPLAWTVQVALQPLLCLIFMYLFLRHLKLDKLPSILGSIAYAFGGFGMIWLEWNVLGTASSFLPLLLYLTDKFIYTSHKKWGIFLSFALAFQILAGYPQIVAFTMVALGLWFVLKSRSLTQGLSVLFFVFLGIMLTSVVLLPGFELFQISQRTVENITLSFRYLPWVNLVTLFAPDYFGNHATGNFWGVGEYTLMTVYSGVVILVLSIIALSGCWVKKEVRYFAFLLILALIIMLPNPISQFLYNMGLWGGPASSTTRAAFLVNFSLAGLGAWGLQRLKDKKERHFFSFSLYLWAALVGVALATWGSKSFMEHSFPLDQMTINLSVATRNLLLPLALLTLSSVLIFFYLRRVISSRYLQLAFILLITLELFRFGWKFNSFSSPTWLYPETPVVKFLKEHAGERINGGVVIPMNMWLGTGMESATGYDAVYPLNWAKFLAVLNSQSSSVKASGRFGSIDDINSKFVDLTSTKYFLALKKDDKGSVDTSGKVDYFFLNSKFRPVFEDKSVVVLENTTALPRAFLVSEVNFAPADKVLDLMLSPTFTASKSAVVEGDRFELKSDSQVVNSLPVYKRVTNNHIQVEVNASTEAMLVVLDSFYPGWEARVDSQPVKLYKTDYAFRGVKVSQGSHVVDFIYYSKSLSWGSSLSLLSIGVLLTILILPIMKGRKDDKS